MKTTHWIALGCISLFLTGCACTNRSSCNSPPPCSRSISACACTDPGCSYSYSPCLTREKCCAAFGNVGALAEPTLESEESNNYDAYSALNENLTNEYRVVAHNATYRKSYKGEVNYKAEVN